MTPIRRKEVLRQIKLIKKSTEPISALTYWDIFRRDYSDVEVAARFLRQRGCKVDIDVNNRLHTYEFEYSRYSRHIFITVKKPIKL